MRSLRIGVLALQGGFAEHIAAFRRLDGELQGRGDHGRAVAPETPTIEPVEVRLPAELLAIDGLVIPGGESTTIGKLMEAYGLLPILRERAARGMPIFGTCAGAIVLAKDIGGLDQPLVGTMDIRVRRNAFGRQLQSFETELRIPVIGELPMRAVFIRAPAIVSAGPRVEILARLDDGAIVAARQDGLLATAFHPELTTDTRLHRYFAGMCAN